MKVSTSVPAASRGAEVTNVEAVIQANLDSLLFVTDAGIEDSEVGEVASTEVIILVLDLSRPALREHVFDASADGVAVATAIAGNVQAI